MVRTISSPRSVAAPGAAYGADRVILHGATPDELQPIIDQYGRADQ
jgi:hypothetical protein